MSRFFILDFDEILKLQKYIQSYLDKAPPKNFKFDYNIERYITDNFGLDYVLEKNKNTCKILSLENNSIFTFIDIDTEFTGFALDDFLEDNGEIFSKQLNSCIRNLNNIIAIPITIDKRHANVLLYRVAENKFEYFEPYGSSFQNDSFKTEQINYFIRRLIEYLVDTEVIPPNYIFMDSTVTCPKFLGEGLQAYEEGFNPFYENVKSIGFCVIWTYFFIDICLKFPTINSVALYDICATYLSKPEKNNYNKFIVSYTYDIYTEIKKKKEVKSLFYGRRFQPQMIKDIASTKLFESYDKIKDLKFKPITRRNLGRRYKDKGKCFNINTLTENDIIDYLENDVSNIILNIFDVIECRNRSDIQEYHEKLINKKEAIIEVSGQRYMLIQDGVYLTKRDFSKLIYDESYVFYNLKYDKMVKVGTKSIRVFSLDAYTIDDYLELEDSYDSELVETVYELNE